MSSRPLHSVCKADKTLCYNRPWVIPDQFPDPAQLRMMTRLHDSSQCLDEIDHRFAAAGKLTKTQHNTMLTAYQQWRQALHRHRTRLQNPQTDQALLAVLECRTATLLANTISSHNQSWIHYHGTPNPPTRRETPQHRQTTANKNTITGLNHQLQTRHSPTMQPHNPAAPRSDPSRTRTQPQHHRHR